jgi:four helix bundle protein
MPKEENIVYDLELRTTEFAKRIIRLCKVLPKNIINNPYISQIIRSSGSIGANYREANDALGKKDFIHRLKISRKEAKETYHWLELISEANPGLKARMGELNQENQELINILSAIIKNSTKKK